MPDDLTTKRCGTDLLCLIEGCSRPYDGTVFICLSAHVCYCVRDLSDNNEIVLFKKRHRAPNFFLCSL